MALQAGDRLAHYDVTALIGEGGMGQVYQATDTKLNRQVVRSISRSAAFSYLTGYSRRTQSRASMTTGALRRSRSGKRRM